jgi:hypothetical protein
MVGSALRALALRPPAVLASTSDLGKAGLAGLDRGPSSGIPPAAGECPSRYVGTALDNAARTTALSASRFAPLR